MRYLWGLAALCALGGGIVIVSGVVDLISQQSSAEVSNINANLESLVLVFVGLTLAIVPACLAFCVSKMVGSR